MFCKIWSSTLGDRTIFMCTFAEEVTQWTPINNDLVVVCIFSLHFHTNTAPISAPWQFALSILHIFFFSSRLLSITWYLSIYSLHHACGGICPLPHLRTILIHFQVLFPAPPSFIPQCFLTYLDCSSGLRQLCSLFWESVLYGGDVESNFCIGLIKLE